MNFKKKIINFLLIFLFIIISYTISLETISALNLIWTWKNEALYTLKWNADIFLVDENWKISWYRNWQYLEEIPWVQEVLYTWNNSGRKQLYMKERKELKVIVVWKKKESYSLLISSWNYYIKIEDIETNKNQIDEIIPRENSVEINFDNNKKWRYNFFMNNYNYENGNIYYLFAKSTWNIQKYIIDWDLVNAKSSNAVKYTIEKDKNDEKNKYWIIFLDDEKNNLLINIWLLWKLILLTTFITLIFFRYKKKINKIQFAMLALLILLFFVIFLLNESYFKK